MPLIFNDNREHIEEQIQDKKSRHYQSYQKIKQAIAKLDDNANKFITEQFNKSINKEMDEMLYNIDRAEPNNSKITETPAFKQKRAETIFLFIDLLAELSEKKKKNEHVLITLDHFEIIVDEEYFISANPEIEVKGGLPFNFSACEIASVFFMCLLKNTIWDGAKIQRITIREGYPYDPEEIISGVNECQHIEISPRYPDNDNVPEPIHELPPDIQNQLLAQFILIKELEKETRKQKKELRKLTDAQVEQKEEKEIRSSLKRFKFV